MGLFDFLTKQQAEAEKMTAPHRLKMDVERSSSLKKKLTALEGTVTEMKAYEEQLTQDLQQAEAFKYGREEKPDYSDKGFEAFLKESAKYIGLKYGSKTVEEVLTEQREFERYKELFLTKKLREIEGDLRSIKQQQLKKLREIEDTFETADNTTEIDYHQIVDMYHKLLWRVNAIAAYCPRYYFSVSFERIERMNPDVKKKKALQDARNTAAHAKSERAAFSGD